MKKLVSLLMAVIFALGCGVAFAEEEIDPAVQASNDAVRAAIQSCQIYFTYYTAYDFDSLMPLFLAFGDANNWNGVNKGAMTDEELIAYNEGIVTAIEEAKKSVVQVKEYDEIRVDFWADPENIPTITEYTVNDNYYRDDPDFVPFMIHVPVPEGVEVKGAIIIMGGGGRNNMQEGSTYGNYFSAAGYQCFVMNNRMGPYTAEESDADVQRAVRYLRANAETYGFEQDQIILAGNSAGGMRTSSVLKGRTGTEKYEFDETYVPDEIDDISFMPNGVIITASRFRYTAEDIVVDPATFPAVFYTSGANDTTIPPTQMLGDALLFYELGIPIEIHTWANVPHSLHMGYDNYSGVTYTNATYWGELALEWLTRALEMGRGGCVE